MCGTDSLLGSIVDFNCMIEKNAVMKVLPIERLNSEAAPIVWRNKEKLEELVMQKRRIGDVRSI